MITKSKFLFSVLLCLTIQTNSFSQNLKNEKKAKSKTIVFIHGLWIHTSSWQQWMDYFNEQGYVTLNPGWPGDSLTVSECRANSQSIANRGVEEIVESYAKIIATLPEPPIVIGHSLGGLIAQILLGRGLVSGCIAIDPAPMKGVSQLPFSAFKASLPVLGNPFNLKKAHSLTYKQFRYGFANAVSEKEARELYDRWTIPAPCRPLFQVAAASFSGAQTKVNTQNITRGPLLIIGGEKDHQAPPIFGKASIKKYNSSVISDFKLFEGRGHSLIVDSGWKEIATYSINWLQKNGL